MGSKQNPGRYDCYSKAKPEEPMFVLLGRDAVASFVVQFWIAMRGLTGTEPEVLAEATECAASMRAWAESKQKDVQKAHASFGQTMLTGALGALVSIWFRLRACGGSLPGVHMVLRFEASRSQELPRSRVREV